MAKIIKSLFNTSERRKSRFDENKDEDSPPADLRRKLSISRSGRMKQANKNRKSLSLDVYGQEIHSPEKQKTSDCGNTETKRRQSTELSPEQEIDSAFEIIDKT